MTDAEFLAEVQKRFPKYVKVGKVTGQVRCYGPAWDFLREHVWRRDNGWCKGSDCHVRVLLEKGTWQTMHAAHYRSKGAGGSDVPSNIRSLCIRCHAAEHSGKDVA